MEERSIHMVLTATPYLCEICNLATRIIQQKLSHHMMIHDNSITSQGQYYIIQTVNCRTHCLEGS
jgi:hypothetical protein